MKPAVVVYGAGVFGVCAALELATRGHRVRLRTRSLPEDAEASSTDISKVVRMDYGADLFYTAAMERALPIWRAWNAAFERPLFHETGVCFLTAGSMNAGGFEADSYALLNARGHALERIEGDFAARAPAWRQGRINDGYINPLGGWAESGAVVHALLERARRMGVAVEAGACSRDAVLGDGTPTVVALGAWTSSVFPELSQQLRPVAQPVVHGFPIDPRPFQTPRFMPWGADIAHTGFYGFPLHPSGRLKVAHHGPGRPIAPDPSVEVLEVDMMRFSAFATEAFSVPVSWAERRLCWYCDSPDGDFWIDRHPQHPHVVVAAGGSGHAFKFAPLLGGWIADAVEGQDPQPRFRWREAAQQGGEAARASE